MKPSLYIGKEPNLQKIIITSAFLHILFIALVVIPLKTKEREYKSYFVNLVGPAEIQRGAKTRVTKKRVPPKKKTVTPKKVVKAKPAPKKRARPKSDVTMETTDRVAKEIERMRAISALAKIKKQKEQEEAESRKADEALDEAIEGIRKKRTINISRTAGMTGTQPSSDMDAYSALVRQRILDEWIHLEVDSSLETIISFYVDKSGVISSIKTVSSSGSILFDRSAVKAIRKASPLPPPAVEDEIEIKFHYDE
jgi:colicin import membrane protein